MAYAECFRGGPKFCRNGVTSPISFMGSAEGKGNRNPGRILNARKNSALLLPKLLGFALHFLFLESEGGHGTVASSLGTLV